MPPSLMVLDAEFRATLGIVRNLGRKGIPLFVGGGGPLSMAGYSRHAAKRFTYPSPKTDR